MTVLVGILCTDGIVIGADSSVTSSDAQSPTIEQTVNKISILKGGTIIVAGTGALGLGQRFCEDIEKRWAEIKHSENPSALAIARGISQWAVDDFRSTRLNQFPYGALVAFPAQSKPALFEFEVGTMQPEMKTKEMWHASMGAGQRLLDPFLALLRDIFWQDGPPKLKDGVFATTWALDHAIRVNPGGINGPARIAVFEKSAEPGRGYVARVMSDDELNEHREVIEGAKGALKDHLANRRQGLAQSPPEAPKPPEPPKPGAA